MVVAFLSRQNRLGAHRRLIGGRALVGQIRILPTAFTVELRARYRPQDRRERGNVKALLGWVQALDRHGRPIDPLARLGVFSVHSQLCRRSRHSLSMQIDGRSMHTVVILAVGVV